MYYKNLWGEYMILDNKHQLREVVFNAVENVQVVDAHTHLYSKDFKELLSWGIDELLTQNEIIAEFFKYSTLTSDYFFKLSKNEQADLVWKTLFIEHSPLSEAQRGIITILSKLGINTLWNDLSYIRDHFNKVQINEYIDKVLEVSKVKAIVMTNNPLNEAERKVLEDFDNRDSRFKSALEVSGILNNYKDNYKKLREMGYKVSNRVDEKSIKEIKRFFEEWAKKMSAVYVLATLPPDFFLPEAYEREKIMKSCIMPVCKELNLPFVMMVGVKKAHNDLNKEIIDSMGRARIEAVEYMCKMYPENKFMVTMLSRENQHELTVAAKRFKNLNLFGGCWSLSNPTLLEETTRIRLETLGLSFIPEYSGARVLEHLISKWDSSRKVISKVLYDKYNDLLDAGWPITEEQIVKDVEYFFNGNFRNFTT